MTQNSFFRPRLLESLQDYNRPRFMKDVGAGVTVGIVALPLAMAFAIASGLKPEAGLALIKADDARPAVNRDTKSMFKPVKKGKAA